MSGIIEALGYQLDPAPWISRAACQGTDPELFFPDRGASTAEARAVCAGCCVRLDCLGYALRWSIEFGVWGGLSTRQRRKLARPERPRRLPPAHGSVARWRQGCHCDACRDAHARYEADRVTLFESDHVRTQDVVPKARYL